MAAFNGPAESPYTAMCARSFQRLNKIGDQMPTAASTIASGSCRKACIVLIRIGGIARIVSAMTAGTTPVPIIGIQTIRIATLGMMRSIPQSLTEIFSATANLVHKIYRAYLTLKLSDIEMQIIEISHACCRWVVCIDPVIDRRMLDDHGKKIIGFTTGEGSYGELNVTVSARKDVLSDIKQFLYKRLASVIKAECQRKLNEFLKKQADWVKQYISPVEYEVRTMNAPRCSAWLSQTQTLPNYLDQQTVKRYHEVRRSVEQRLHSCRVQGVVSMFNELSNEEKEECLKILQKTT